MMLQETASFHGALFSSEGASVVQDIKLTSEYDYLFKILLIGDSGVGKSCLTKR